jgi:hypothetical protein
MFHSNTEQNGGSVQSPDAHDTSTDTFPRLREIAGSLIFYLGIPAATLYPMEAAIFLLQLMSYYGHSYWTAAYSVSLIASSTMVTWAVYDLLFVVALGIACIIPALILTSVWVAKGRSVVWGTSWRKTPRRRLAALLIVTIYTGGVLLFVVAGGYSQLMDNRLGMWTAIVGVFWILGAIASGYILGTDFRKSRRGEGQSATRVPTRRWLAKGALFTYLFNACLLISYLGATTEPGLPAVDFDEDNRADGHLLGLSDGYWHFLDTEGNIVAVPTDQVGSVTLRYPGSESRSGLPRDSTE